MVGFDFLVKTCQNFGLELKGVASRFPFSWRMLKILNETRLNACEGWVGRSKLSCQLFGSFIYI